MRRSAWPLTAFLIALLLAPAPAPSAAAEGGEHARGAQSSGDRAAMIRALRSQLRRAGSGASVYVLDATARRRLYSRRGRSSRILASNVKLFTTAAALARMGTKGTIETAVWTDDPLLEDGTLEGDLHLRGGGDPAFGSAAYAGRRLGSPATVEALAKQLADIVGIRRVEGRIRGDESAFDSLRGGPDSGFGPSPWHGPLSALSFDEGRGRGGMTPPQHAAARLDAALEDEGVRVRRRPATGATPDGARRLAAVSSLTMDRLVRTTNKASSNFFAEMLLKRLAATPRRQGTTRMGARIAARFARGLGARVRMADGSGLSRSNRASARAVVELLDEMRVRPEFRYFSASLPVAGRDGTLAKRMRRGPARRRCRAKTGTLSNVSALSGYCRGRSGRTIVFSFLANGVSPTAMKRIEDRMAATLVRHG